MFDKLNYIELSGKKYALKCDMLVLEKIQEKYEDLIKYENKLSGFVPGIDENGEYTRNEEGKLVGTYEEPNIRVLNDSLCWMVQEGLDIEREEGKEVEEISDKNLLRMVDLTPRELSKILHNEFFRCFERKNGKTTQREKEKKTQ